MILDLIQEEAIHIQVVDMAEMFVHDNNKTFCT